MKFSRHRARALARRELRHLTAIQASDRAWQMPFAAALATGLPVLIGAWFGHLAYGLVSSLGGLTFLYLPGTPLHHRMVFIMACAFGMTTCYALGMISHFFAPAMMPMLIFIAILVTMIARFYRMAPPGSLFFIMAAAIGAYTPVQTLQLPLMVGLVAMGSALACLIGFFYSLYMLRTVRQIRLLPCMLQLSITSSLIRWSSAPAWEFHCSQPRRWDWTRRTGFR